MPLRCGCDNWYHNNDDNASSKTNKEMSNLNDIASLGRELGFYILYTCSLPMAVRNQLNIPINMGVPTLEIEKMVFSNNNKQSKLKRKRFTHDIFKY